MRIIYALLVIATLLTANDIVTAQQAKITPPKDAKCPVCGMWVAKYPKWIAMIDLGKEKLYFDGVKDMMKFYLDPKRFKHQKEKVLGVWVTDYYTLKTIDAHKAYFVTGSNVYGPMGEELIPFTTKTDAQEFLHDHHGKAIVTFSEITPKLLY